MYEYDVFISYTRDHPAGTWVKDRLLRDFVGYLAEEMGRRPKIFFDQHEIQPGENWAVKIGLGLKASKVLVAVCSARYFYDSEFCRLEWYTFGEIDIAGKRVNRPRVPVRFNDGSSFPLEARQTQQIDFSDCNYIIEAFYKNDVRAVIYEENVRALAKAVVKALNAAPPYTSEFPLARLGELVLKPLRQPQL